MTTTPTTDVAVVDPVSSDVEQHALAAFLAGYRGLTGDAYALDLRQFIAWCQEHNVRLFAARRADIECFAPRPRGPGAGRGQPSPSPVHGGGLLPRHRAGGLLERSPAGHVRGLASTTSPTRPVWTATRSERSWSPPDSRRPQSTRSCRCSPSTVCASPRLWALTSRRSAPTRPSHPHGAAQGRQGRHDPARALYRTSDRPGAR